MKRTQYAVKHGKKFTTFESDNAALRYAAKTLGSTLLYRNDAGHWVSL